MKRYACPSTEQSVLRRLPLISSGAPHCQIDTFNSGACAVLAYMQRSSLWVASTGDCRAILGTQMQSGELQTHPLSVDHNVDHPMERVRLEMHGASLLARLLTTAHISIGATMPVPVRLRA
jgi:serine/threonine protein phosphatase PrpC